MWILLASKYEGRRNLGAHLAILQAHYFPHYPDSTLTLPFSPLLSSWPHEYAYPENLHDLIRKIERPSPNRFGFKEEHPTGEETVAIQGTHTPPVWFKLLLSAGFFSIAYYWTTVPDLKEGQVHPITQWMKPFFDRYAATEAFVNSENEKWREIAMRAADDHLILKAAPPNVWRTRFPGQFERCSDSCLVPGEQYLDISTIKIKHDWEIDDDFGPPYPKNKVEE